MLRFPLHGVAYNETLYISTNDCLQHCKLFFLLAEGGGFLPPVSD